MAKRFSIVQIPSLEEEVFLTGFVEPKDLSKSEVVVEIMSEVASSEYISMQIQHCLFLDYPGDDEDITVETLEEILDVFDDLVEDEYIFVEDILDFELPGLNTDDEEYIET